MEESQDHPLRLRSCRTTPSDVRSQPTSNNRRRAGVARRLLLLGFSVWLVVGSLISVADARIRKPKIEELVDSADVIVVGTVEGVRPTSAASWLGLSKVALLIGSGVIVAVLLWRRKVAVAGCVVLACLLVVLQFHIPLGAYRRVARVSVSRTIKGVPSPGEIAVYYDDGFVCDETCFDVGEEYLLFLKKLSSDYTVSWYDWSVWTVNAGQAQTERRGWHNAAPIPVAELAARIEDILDRQQEKGKAIATKSGTDT
jgi:hypothetical protein